MAAETNNVYLKVKKVSLFEPGSLAVMGSFSEFSRSQELVVSRGTVLKLLSLDVPTGDIKVLCHQDIFGIVRSLLAFRLTAGTRDFIAVGSDSGRIAILQYNADKTCFEWLHQETFGKTGCRRIVPGHYLAVDPLGRALMSAAEQQKLVYIMNRDEEGLPPIPCPLAAHKQHTLCYAMVGVDVGFENPTFACLEFDYEDADNDLTGEAAKRTQQTLTFYELDLGLNHAVRKYTKTLTDPGNLLIAVPGGNDGPSGVIVCCENYLVYKNLGDQPDIRCQIPRRRNELDDADRTMLIIATATHKTKNMFFFLVQAENGDVFKVTLETDEDLVTEMKLKYFDTVPPANAMFVLESGFLFVAAEFGNHELYQIASLGEGGDDEFSSAMGFGENDAAFFEPHEWRNSILHDTKVGLFPLTDAVTGDVAREDAAQLYTLVDQSVVLKRVFNGLEIFELALSDVPCNPNAVWTVKKKIGDFYDSYIVVSFAKCTHVINTGNTDEMASSLGLLPTTPTIGCSMIGDGSLVQIYAEGIRHIRADKRINEWKAPPRRQIVKCCVNRRQVAVALSGRELVYFEFDLNGTLTEFTERKLFNADIACMTFSEVSEGKLKSRFLALGTVDNAVRIISLDPNDMLMPLSTQNLPCPPESILLIDTPNDDGKGVAAVHLNIGLQNGCLFRNTVDNVTGAVMDTRRSYLGTRPVKLFKVQVQGRSAILCTSSRSWLLNYFQCRFHLTPLSYPDLEYATGYCSDECVNGIVAISSSTLRIIGIKRNAVAFNVQSFEQKMTPRRIAVHPTLPRLVAIETEHAAYTESTKNLKRDQMAQDVEAMASDEQEAQLANRTRGKLAPVISLISLNTGAKLIFSSMLLDNENAKCLALIQFSKHPDAVMILVGCGVNERLNPSVADPEDTRHIRGCVYTYRMNPTGDRFDFQHRTETPLPVGAIHDFRGMALVGFGRHLRMYDIGQNKLLAKCENKDRGQPYTTMSTWKETRELLEQFELYTDKNGKIMSPLKNVANPLERIRKFLLKKFVTETTRSDASKQSSVCKNEDVQAAAQAANGGGAPEAGADQEMSVPLGEMDVGAMTEEQQLEWALRLSNTRASEHSGQQKLKMVQESTMICVDNSEWMRNGDFQPTRLQSQQDAVNLVTTCKLRANPENAVGILSMADSVKVLSSLSTEQGRLMMKTHSIEPYGKCNFIDGLNTAYLALKHRQNRNHKMRVVLFIGSPLEDIDSAELIRIGKKMKTEKMICDVIMFGDNDVEGHKKMTSFVETLNGKEGTGSALIVVPTGSSLTEALKQSSVCKNEDGQAAFGGVEGGADAEFANGGGAPDAGEQVENDLPSGSEEKKDDTEKK